MSPKSLVTTHQGSHLPFSAEHKLQARHDESTTKNVKPSYTGKPSITAGSLPSYLPAITSTAYATGGVVHTNLSTLGNGLGYSRTSICSKTSTSQLPEPTNVINGNSVENSLSSVPSTDASPSMGGSGEKRPSVNPVDEVAVSMKAGIENNPSTEVKSEESQSTGSMNESSSIPEPSNSSFGVGPITNCLRPVTVTVTNAVTVTVTVGNSVSTGKDGSGGVNLGDGSGRDDSLTYPSATVRYKTKCSKHRSTAVSTGITKSGAGLYQH